MSGLRAYTVAERWPRYSVTGDRCLEVVQGLVLPDGQELWSPSRTGVDPRRLKDAKPGIELPFDEVLAQRVGSFFSDQFLAWSSTSPYLLKYTCHKFAWWLQGVEVDPVKDARSSETRAREVVRTGRRVEPQDMKIGELAVIGGADDKGIVADHSVINMDGVRGVQVLGSHGPLAIAEHARVVAHYKQLTARSRAVPEEAYGMYVPTEVPQA